MRRIVRLPLILLFLTSAFPGTLQTPEQRPGKIVGTIHLPKGEHEIPELMTVTLSTMSGSILFRQTLNGKDLTFAFTGITNGNYIITLESTGYETVEKEVEVTSYVVDEETFVTLTLGKPLPDDAPGVPKTGQKTVTAKLLSLPADVRKELEKAGRESQRGKPEKAIEHLKAALAIKPDLYHVYNNLAVEYMRLGNKAEALAALEHSLNLNPNDATTYRNVAQIHLSNQAFPKAVQSLRKALELEPKNSKNLSLVGEAYLGLRQYQLALNAFQQAAQENAEDYNPLGLGQCYLRLGREAEALRELKNFLDRSPKDPRAESIRSVVAELEKTAAP